MIDPEQAKEFTLDMQKYVIKIIKSRFSSYPLSECLEIANEIVDYSFNLMLRTHREKIDDDIPF